jgi:hypothetical protein
MATMRPVIVGLGVSKVVLKAVELTRLEKVSEVVKMGGKEPHPPMRPLSYPISRKPRHVSDVTAVKRRRPSRAMTVDGQQLCSGEIAK